jgi:hypothetical protein
MRKVWSLAVLCLALLSGAHAQESFGLANSATGTTLNTLTKVVVNGGVPQAQIVATTDTSGAVGITTLGQGTTGTAIVTRSGIAPCVFDNTTVAGDFVQIASGTAGNCHDAGATRPTSGQIIGVVIQTGGSAGTYNVLLDKSIFPAASSAASCAALGSSDTISTATTFATTCSLGAPAGVGSIVIIDAQGVLTTTATASPQVIFQVNVGSSTGICPQLGNITASTNISNQPWHLHCEIQIATTGGPGTAWAWGDVYYSNAVGGNQQTKMMANGTATASYTTTSSQTVAIQETGAPVAGQTYTLQSLKAYAVNP